MGFARLSMPARPFSPHDRRGAVICGELVPGFEPESELERALVAELELRRASLGRPRLDDPEARVELHVAAKSSRASVTIRSRALICASSPSSRMPSSTGAAARRD